MYQGQDVKQKPETITLGDGNSGLKSTEKKP